MNTEITQMTGRIITKYFLTGCGKDTDTYSWNKQGDIVSDEMGYDIWEFKGFAHKVIHDKLS